MRIKILKFNALRAASIKVREGRIRNNKISREQISAIAKFRKVKICRLDAALSIARRNLKAKFSRAAAA